MSDLRLPGVVAGADDRLAPQRRFECGVCWHVYDPAEGDPVAQLPPGIAFADLPDWWRCPTCDNDRSVFLPLADEAPPPAADPASRVAAAFAQADARMRGLPVYHPGLRVEALGFQPYAQGWIGMLITPWCMNVILLPEGEAWDHLVPGAEKQPWSLPAGAFDFEVGRIAGLGSYQSLSLFSPMTDFRDHGHARETAEIALAALLTADPDAATAAAAPATAPPAAPSRRDLLRGRFGGKP